MVRFSKIVCHHVHKELNFFEPFFFAHKKYNFSESIFFKMIYKARKVQDNPQSYVERTSFKSKYSLLGNQIKLPVYKRTCRNKRHYKFP